VFMQRLSDIISRREIRILGVVLLALFIFLIHEHLIDFFYFRPLRIRTHLLDERNNLENAQLTIQARPRIESRLAARRKQVEGLNRRLLPGDKPPVAAARLQRIIDEIAGETNVDITRQRIVKPTEHKLLLEVPVEVVFRCNVGALKDFLYRIESHQVLLTLPQWSIRVLNQKTPKQVQVNMTIAGFIKKA
jgi:hypothetical protein